MSESSARTAVTNPTELAAALKDLLLSVDWVLREAAALHMGALCRSKHVSPAAILSLQLDRRKFGDALRQAGVRNSGTI